MAKAPIYKKIGLPTARAILNKFESATDLNRTGAAKHFQHDPTPDEALIYFASPEICPHGAAELEERHPYLVFA